jgi:hypothetical protein
LAGTVGLGAFTDIIVTSPIEVSFGELLAPRISGGIVLCPATLFLLSAVSTQRVGFGLLLIVIGVVITLFGLAMAGSVPGNHRILG